MAHLSEEQFYETIFDNTALSEEAQSHLQGCMQCQQQLLMIRRLAHELKVARRSQPTPLQLERYFQYASEIQVKPSPWAQLSEQLQMTLALDGRRRLGLQGLRGAGPRAYRLLYSARAADVELLVETQGQMRRIQGEVLPLDEGRLHPPVFAELRLAENRPNHVDLVAESNEQGRFQFDGVMQGYYQLTITPIEGPALRIEGIDIT
jgi:hypothetical protein